MSDKILPVILCGGTGTRLWPVSREGMAKQLLPILGEETLLQMTLRRVKGADFAEPMVIGAHPVRFTIREQVEAVAPSPAAVTAAHALRRHLSQLDVRLRGYHRALVRACVKAPACRRFNLHSDQKR